MTQVYVVSGIIILVAALVCYIFVRQTVVKRQKERLRLQRALEKRAKDLMQILASFPSQFLPNDLMVFIYRCIVDVFEQLIQLEPNNSDYLDNLTLYSSQLETIVKTPINHSIDKIDNSAQINELRQHLNYLGRFIQKWAQLGNISSKQYAHYKSLLKNLITQLMVDNYSLSAKGAIEIQKHKLATHYYKLSKNLITKEGLAQANKEHLVFINQEIIRLEKMTEAEESQQDEETQSSTTEDESSIEKNTQWQNFNSDDSWKKKNVYD